MTRFRQTLLVLLLTILSGATVAQNNTNSPYTRYGYGQLADQGSGNSKAMGGIAYGLRDKYQTNFANPASYTAVDSLTFMFDGGISMQNTNFSDGTVKKNAKNSSFDYITMQFRLSKWGAMSIGLLPYSNVGYTMASYQENTEAPENSANTTYAGEGGLHQLYLGAGFKIFKNLSVGANISYLWGDITHTRSQSFPSNSTVMPLNTATGMEITSYKLDFGAQYTQALNKKSSLTIGAVYSPKHKLNNDYTSIVIMGASSSSYGTEYKDVLDATFELPNTFGVGFTYNYDKRLTVGADYSLQQWSKTNFGVVTSDENVRQDFNETFTYCDRTKISVGAEYIPNLIGRSYFAHIKYRLGAYYTTPYYKIDGKKASREYGVTAGFGLPVPRSRSILSISGQFVRVKGLETNMVNENIFRVSIGLTFNERWFFKRRVE